MSTDEFERHSREYANGKLSRRKFMRRLVAGGMSVAAARALVGGVSQPVGAAPRISIYGEPRGFVYGTPGVGQQGSPPGQGGDILGLRYRPRVGDNPPGKGGKVPGPLWQRNP